MTSPEAPQLARRVRSPRSERGRPRHVTRSWRQLANSVTVVTSLGAVEGRFIFCMHRGEMPLARLKTSDAITAT
jgi:hypothetical protein